MNRRRVVLVVLIIACVVASILIFGRSRQPVYQGRSIGYWFEQLPVTLVSSNAVVSTASFTIGGQTYGSTGTMTSQAYAAFDQFGTNAIPYLMSKFQDEDSYGEKNATKLAAKLGVKKVPFRYAKIERCQAITALLRLELPAEFFPTLSRLTTNGDPDIAGSARFILSRRQQKTGSTTP